jgi:hypothetical protein
MTNGAQAADLALQGGTPIYVKQFMKDHGFPDKEIASLPHAVARAHRQIHDGADGVKLN